MKTFEHLKHKYKMGPHSTGGVCVYMYDNGNVNCRETPTVWIGEEGIGFWMCEAHTDWGQERFGREPFGPQGEVEAEKYEVE